MYICASYLRCCPLNENMSVVVGCPLQTTNRFDLSFSPPPLSSCSLLRQVYSQLEAEDSNNDLLSKAYGIINSKLDGVTSMSLDYGGQG